jgi:hypothetical protein
VRDVRSIIYAAGTLALAALMVAACGKKAAEGPPADELKNEIAAVTGELNAYLSEHNFANTDAGALAAEITKQAGKYGEFEKQARELKAASGNDAYGEVGGLAAEGRAKAEALASAVAAGPPRGEAAKVATLHAAIDGWADYSDRIGAPPGEAAPVEGEEPGVGEPVPGEPGATAEPVEPGEPSKPGEPSVGEPTEPGEPVYPGKGHHYGWWKNPEWARDRGTRPLVEGEVPGTGEMERERERDRGGKATGPEREREREHVQPGTGKGGGMGPGAGLGGGQGKGKGGGAGGQ